MRGGGKNPLSVKVSENHIRDTPPHVERSLYMRGYRKLNKMTFTVVIKHQKFTVLEKA